MTENYQTKLTQVSNFRNWISPTSQFTPEPNRYHLYVAYACPWAHRTLIVLNLKGLNHVISHSIVNSYLGPNGWSFNNTSETTTTASATPSTEMKDDVCTKDPLYNYQYLSEIYKKANPDFVGRYTVPVLWDKKTQTIVNNESAEIIRMLNDQFNEFATNSQLDLYPLELRSQIDATNTWVYDCLNFGVYKAGFTTVQAEYEKSAILVRDGLIKCEEILSKQPYIVSDRFTEADIRLFTTILRFDPVYYVHFKCNLISVRELPHLLAWLKKIYNKEGIKETVNMKHIKATYYNSHKQINPTGIVPVSNGPDLSLN